MFTCLFLMQELEKCDANHYIILFRDAGCQFRALYCYYPDTEEIYKLTGTGPKSITKKMIDKLYKYSSDRKQFNVIPAKTMSVSVDALTIHNHLWQAKRPAVPKKTQTRKWHWVLGEEIAEWDCIKWRRLLFSSGLVWNVRNHKHFLRSF